MNRRNTDAMLRSTARREREAQAPRLLAEVPDLLSLNVEVTERGAADATDVVYIRRVVVASASTLFEMPCGDPACVNGGHDFSEAIMASLRAARPSFSGEDTCRGVLAEGLPCQRAVRVSATATYRPHAKTRR